MNDLLVVRKRITILDILYNKNKVINIKKQRNIKMYINALLNQSKYKLIIKTNSIIKIQDENRFIFGHITRSRNKKLFDKLYLTVRLLNEWTSDC